MTVLGIGIGDVAVIIPLLGLQMALWMCRYRYLSLFFGIFLLVLSLKLEAVDLLAFVLMITVYEMWCMWGDKE